MLNGRLASVEIPQTIRFVANKRRKINRSSLLGCRRKPIHAPAAAAEVTSNSGWGARTTVPRTYAATAAARAPRVAGGSGDARTTSR